MEVSLRNEHLHQLTEGSGISLDVIRERGYRSVTKSEISTYGFCPNQYRDGLLIPIWTTDGKNGMHILRPDNPRTKGNGKSLKYELPRGSAVRLDVPPRCCPSLIDTRTPLWITEGQKKADAMATHGLCAMDLIGVWGFKGRNASGGTTWLVDWDHIALDGRDVFIVFDSDVSTKSAVRLALERLTAHLQRRDANVRIVYLPPGPEGEKVGVDDFLLTHTVDDIKGLVQKISTIANTATPVTEILDEGPLAMTRPLSILANRGYAAAWMWQRTTITESLVKGEIKRHDPPIRQTRRELCVVRDDGTVFGPGWSQSLSELGLDVQISDRPKDAKLWSSSGVRAFNSGYRPNPCDVFRRIRSLVDYFMSFERSIATQDRMCELVSCYAISTWFLDALYVIGYVWPTGPSGSGKTKLGTLICEVAHLGEVLLSGSSYPTLRDLADMGATLLFDDAEDMANPKSFNPDKRNLLLAGNRKGSVVTVKELAPDKTWKTRHVNTFCPRLFTATQLPDPILGTRTIILPLIRTADKCKANREVLEHRLWPCDKRTLVDDLWCMALSRIKDIPQHEEFVNQASTLIGRNLEPWRPILAIAHWLGENARQSNDADLSNIYDRMAALAQSYQTEKVTLETPDPVKLVVRAIVHVAKTSVVPLPPFENWTKQIKVAAADIVRRVDDMVENEDLGRDGAGRTFISAKQVGKILTNQLRLKPANRERGKGRERLVTLAEIDGLAKAYGLPGLDSLDVSPGSALHSHDAPPSANGGNGANGTTVLSSSSDTASSRQIQ